MATAISTNVLRQKATQLVFVDESTAGTLSSAPSGSNGSTEQSSQRQTHQSGTSNRIRRRFQRLVLKS